MACDLAAFAGVVPQLPRIVCRSTFRANVSAPTITDYYRLNVFIPFLDHLIQELTTQFQSMQKY
jgi:hypothetical protein